MVFFSHGDIYDIVEVDVEKRVILYDYDKINENLEKSEQARNIFAVNRDGETLWRISTQFDEEGHPFIEMYMREGQLYAYRWDSFEYAIDVETGFA